MQTSEVTCQKAVLTPDGDLAVEGWARANYFAYNRDVLPRRTAGLVEADIYTLYNPGASYWITLALIDDGFKSTRFVSFTDLRLHRSVQCSASSRHPGRVPRLAASSSEDSWSTFLDRDCRLTLTIMKRDEKRHLIFNAPSLVLPDGSVGLLGDFSLLQERTQESISSCMGRQDDPKAFHLAQRILPLPVVSGYIRRGREKDMLAMDRSLAVLSWTRSRHMKHLGRMFSATALSREASFTFGYGCEKELGVLVRDGSITHLGEVDFNLHKDIMKPWILKDARGDVDLVFTPQCTLSPDCTGCGTTVFGHFSGTVTDAGGKITDIDGTAGCCSLSQS